jgi:hypothetical protein
MTPWKYTDATRTVCNRTLDDGREQSARASALSAEDRAAILDPDPPTAVQQREVVDIAEREAFKSDGPLMTLVNQTRAEWIIWARANFPSLTQPEQTRLGNLFWVVSIGVRRAVR